MASHSAFKIRLAHEGCGSFFAAIRTEELPEGLAAQFIPESKLPGDSWDLDSPVHQPFSFHPVEYGGFADWTVSFRSPSARLPVCKVPCEKH